MEILDAIFAHATYWLIGGLALMVLEVILPGIYLFWVGLGALVVGVCVQFFPALEPTEQLLIFVVAMLGSVVLGIRLQSRHRAGQASTLNRGLANYVGRTVVAETDFHASHGRVRVDDTTYAAHSDDTIRQGDVLTVWAVSDGRFEVRLNDRPVG